MAEQPIRVLVVDDNPDNVAILIRRLQRRGYLPSQAGSGREALEKLKAEPIDIVVLDMMMPEMDGIEVLRCIRANPRLANLPVIIATAKMDSTDMVTALEQGADDYVTKPIDFEVLQARLRAVLRRRPALPPAAEPALPVAPPAPVSRKVGVGSVLDGKYRLDLLIGSGGFGAVYKGTHLTLANVVAIKILHPQIAESKELRQRFQQEGVSLCRVRHPNAVTVFDAGTSEGRIPYLVMEYLEGMTLEAFLTQRGILPLPRAAYIISQVCDVLHHAHKTGVVHRDIKPANIYLTQTPRGEVVKVLDFGIARLLHRQNENELSKGQSLMGTPQFMAPERLTGEPSDHRVDVYAIGATLYLMLTGMMPHGPTEKNIIQQMRKQLSAPLLPICSLLPSLPGELAAIIMSTLARDPQKRPELPVLQQHLRNYATEWSGESVSIKVSFSTDVFELGDTLQGAPTAPPQPDSMTQIMPSPELAKDSNRK